MVSPEKTQKSQWLDELFQVEREVRVDLGKLSPEQFNWRPAEGKWSVAECIDHLAVTTGLMLEKAKPVLEKARADGKTGQGPYRYGMLGGWFVKMMEQPGKRPMPSPRNFAPGSDLVKAEVLARYAAVMKGFAQAIESSYDLPLDQLKAGSAAERGGWLKFGVAAWYAASLAHHRRHVAQARRVMGTPEFPR
jgi:DinB family protein